MVTTSFLACTAPRLVAPAMNDRMYADAATQANLATLRERGVVVIEPDEGALASRGEHGKGRLPEPARAAGRRIEAVLPAGERPWDGLRVLVTAGGTREPIDPVRFVGNRSSGRMGLALAAAAARPRRRGDAGRRQRRRCPSPPGVRRIDVETAAELDGGGAAPSSRPADVLLMAAAPADFRPARRRREQDQARAGGGSSSASSRPRTSSPALAAGEARGPDDRRLRRRDTARAASARAREKLARKGADMIVLNDVSDPEIGFESERNAVTLVEAGGEREVPIDSKEAIAEAILDRVDVLRERRRQPASEPPDLRRPTPAGFAHWVHGPDREKARSRSRSTRSIGAGVELLEDGSFEAATEPLAEAARRAPEKSSVREALGRAYFRNRQFEEAAAEFEAVVETHPVNDFAHFCLGRALSITGDVTPGPPSPGAGLEPAPGAPRLPHLPRAPGPQRLSAAGAGARPAGQPRLGLGRRARRSPRSAPGCSCCSGSPTATTPSRPTASPPSCASCAIFDDAEGRMNEPLGEREVLCVSQFTLYGDTSRGNRPSYVAAAPPEVAEPLYERVLRGARRGARRLRRPHGRRAGKRRAGDAAARGLSGALGLRGVSARRGYTARFKLFHVPRTVSRSGPGPLFFRPGRASSDRRMRDLQSDIESRLASSTRRSS